LIIAGDAIVYIFPFEELFLSLFTEDKG
jgi:hypothetical protein